MAAQNVERAVGGGPVDDDGFDGGVVLRQHAAQGAFQGSRRIAHRRDDADERTWRVRPRAILAVGATSARLALGMRRVGLVRGEGGDGDISRDHRVRMSDNWLCGEQLLVLGGQRAACDPAVVCSENTRGMYPVEFGDSFVCPPAQSLP